MRFNGSQSPASHPDALLQKDKDSLSLLPASLPARLAPLGRRADKAKYAEQPRAIEGERERRERE